MHSLPLHRIDTSRSAPACPGVFAPRRSLRNWRRVLSTRRSQAVPWICGHLGASYRGRLVKVRLAVRTRPAFWLQAFSCRVYALPLGGWVIRPVSASSARRPIPCSRGTARNFGPFPVLPRIVPALRRSIWPPQGTDFAWEGACSPMIGGCGRLSIVRAFLRRDRVSFPFPFPERGYPTTGACSNNSMSLSAWRR